MGHITSDPRARTRAYRRERAAATSGPATPNAIQRRENGILNILILFNTLLSLDLMCAYVVYELE